MKIKSIKIITTTLIISAVFSFSSLAAWEQSEADWKYKDDNTGVYLTGWQWLDGNKDNIAECYYLDVNGIMAANTEIEGYAINTDGQWTVDGFVQTKTVSSDNTTTNTQNNGGVPSLSDIIADVGPELTEGSCGDSTGLPPMEAGSGSNQSNTSNSDIFEPEKLITDTTDSSHWGTEGSGPSESDKNFLENR